MSYPQSIPSPYTMHQHPYPTRFHGGIWRRPSFGMPYVRQPLNVIRPSQMAGMGGVTAIGTWDTGQGVFRRPKVDGGGVFNSISGLGQSLGLADTTTAFLGGGIIAFGVVFIAIRKKKMTPNRSRRRRTRRSGR